MASHSRFGKTGRPRNKHSKGNSKTGDRLHRQVKRIARRMGVPRAQLGPHR